MEKPSYTKPSKEELKKKLTDLQYKVTQEAHTERPWTGEYNKVYDQGRYTCIVCDSLLFNSDTKFDSGCGWPAFYKGIEANIEEHRDVTHGMVRTEVVCKICKAHLGHVFNDGPKKWGGIRYCINSASIQFHPAGEK